MKKQNKIFSILSVSLLALGISGYAQEEIVFNPADLIPHDDGYYIAGVETDEDENGIPEFHNQCEDYYESEPDGSPDWFYDVTLNHMETGEQQEFSYFNCMIMPTCDAKSTPIEPPVATGYIQIHPCLYSYTDSAVYSYVQTPPVSNLISIYLETSSDVSINEKRHIPYFIEFSKDGGDTWENTYVGDEVQEQGGYRVSYDGTVHSEILDMIDASKASPIVIRIITGDRGVEGAQQGQFVKLHSFKITAEKASSIQNTQVSDLVLRIENRTIVSENSEIEVYNVMGQFIGTGNFVQVPGNGIYMVRSGNSPVQKILVK